MRPISNFALILSAMAALTVASGAAAQSQPTLEERMSQGEFRAAGLDKLSPAELQQLNAWIQTHSTTETRMVTSTGAPVFYPNSSDRESIEAHIDGIFTGWRGKTVFRLDNGQEWQQAESGTFDAGKLNSPNVRIKPMLLGSWLMYVDNCGCNVRVARIK